MKKKFYILIIFALITTLLTSCKTSDTHIFTGKVINQQFINGWIYDKYEYIIETETANFTFIIRDGSLLIPGATYVFSLRHIENNEYVSREIKQIP